MIFIGPRHTGLAQLPQQPRLAVPARRGHQPNVEAAPLSPRREVIQHRLAPRHPHHEPLRLTLAVDEVYEDPLARP